MTEENLFTKSIDSTRQDRLLGEILAHVSDAEQQGYTNMEIARTLLRAAHERAWREPVRMESFLQWQIDEATRTQANVRTIRQDAVLREETNKLN